MDERLAEIERQKQEAQNKSNSMYEGLLQDNQNLYEQQKSFADQYEQSQNEALDKQLAFNEQKIEQQKAEARKNMEAESQRARNDYFAYINPYGVQAESLASQGLLNSGVSETAKLGGYNTYQNRLSSANKVMQDAFTQYDNDMNEARLNNDVQKAQNALAKLQMQLQYAENYYNQKSNLSQNQLQSSQNLDSEYYNRYNTEYNNIQQEKAREEAIRQWEAEMAYQKEQDQLAQQNWEREYQLSKSQNYSSGYSLDNSDDLGNVQIETNFFKGNINPDVQYGTFDTEDRNGIKYQPDNINGQKLKKSGMTVAQFTGRTGNQGYTNANVDNQNVWELNGRYYMWDGSLNEYVDISSFKKAEYNTKELNTRSYSTKSVAKNNSTNNVSNTKDYYQEKMEQENKKWLNS